MTQHLRRSDPRRTLSLAVAVSSLALGALACGNSETLGRLGTGGQMGRSTGGDGSTLPPPISVGGSAGVQPSFGATVFSSIAPRPISGGTMRLSKSGDRVFVSDPDRDQVSVVDLTTDGGRVALTVPLMTGDEPGRLVEGPAGKLFVSLRGGGAIASVDLASGGVTRQAVCGAPRGLAYDDVASVLYVACEDGTLAMIAADGSISRSTLERDLRDVTLAPDRVLISRLRSTDLIACNRQGALLGKTKAPDVFDINLARGSTFQGTVAWRTDTLPDGRVLMLHQRASNGSIVTSRPGGYGGLDCSTNIVHTAITIFDPVTMKAVSTTMPFGRAVLPVDFAYLPESRRIAVVAAGNAHTPKLSSLFFVSADATRPVTSDEADASTPLSLGLFTPNGTGGRQFMPIGGAGGSPGRGPLGGATATGAVGGTDGSEVAGSSGVAGGAPGGAGGFRTNTGGTGGSSPVLAGSTGMGTGCLDNAAQGVNSTGEPVAVVYSAKLGLLVVQSREPAQLTFYTGSGSILGSLSLAYASVGDTGHAVFHSNAGASIACASCHAEGAEDGHVWTFSETGPRRTQSLRGGILGTEPFHWNGDMKDLSTIMDQVFVSRMSGPVLASDQKEGLSRFIEAIPRLPAPPALDPTAVARGKALFEDTTKAACVSCHSGTRMTNNMTVDVGTKGSFQVPSLLGVGWRTPLMHDGCAASLGDRFDPACGGTSHGNTVNLTAQDKADLVSYMQTL